LADRVLLKIIYLLVLLLPKISSMLVGDGAWVRPMSCATAAGGALVRPGNAVTW
jgi:hypothetical protein